MECVVDELKRKKFFDAVVIGTELPGLLCAAILSRRGLRVLLLGDHTPPPVYVALGREWPRAPSTYLMTHSPVAERVLSELALTPDFRRNVVALDPRFQVVSKKMRFEYASDDVVRSREIDREFPALRRAIDELYRNSDRLNSELDELLSRDLMWPPETFFERRAMQRATAHRLFARDGHGADPFGDLPSGQPFWEVVRGSVAFAADADPDQLPPLAITRLHHAWTHGSAAAEVRPAWFERRLREFVENGAGEFREDARVSQVHVSRGAVTGLSLDGSDEEIGARFVIFAREVAALLPLLPDRTAMRDVFEKVGEPTPRLFRYTLNLWLQGEGVPPGIGRDVLLSFEDEDVDLRRIRLEVSPEQRDGLRRLTLQALLPRRAVENVPGYMDTIRERILANLRTHFPFLDDHLEFVDSPHDGRPIEDVRGKSVFSPSAPWSRGPSTMEALFGYPVKGVLGICGLPIRTPVKNLLLCNRQNIPGLGVEGAFLAALGAAGLAAKGSARKTKLMGRSWAHQDFG